MTTKPQWCSRRMIQNPFFMGVCLSEVAFHKALRGMKVPRSVWPEWIKTHQAHATAHIFEGLRGGNAAIVCLRGWEGRDPIEVAGLLVHEGVHIWQHIREFIGEHHPSAEFEAYSLQAIAQDLMQAFVDAQKATP